jgi:hypothetical protein
LVSQGKSQSGRISLFPLLIRVIKCRMNSPKSIVTVKRVCVRLCRLLVDEYSQRYLDALAHAPYKRKLIDDTVLGRS